MCNEVRECPKESGLGSEKTSGEKYSISGGTSNGCAASENASDCPDAFATMMMSDGKRSRACGGSYAESGIR
jgi:hypothetical protein